VLAPGAASAQGVTSASVAGTVTTSIGQPLPGALVTLTALGAGGSQGSSREATTNSTGAYAFALIPPGSYEIRAEALGYRPVVARTLTLGGGERGAVSLVLTQSPPPILTVDTLVLGGSATSRWRAGGTRFSANEIDGLAHRFEDLTSIASLATTSDGSLGSEGLPGGMTVLIADGVPFYRASHPLGRAEQLATPLFGRSMLATVAVQDDATDIESFGSAGGFVSLSTRAGTTSGGLELDGAWSGAPLWSSSQLDISTPSLTSVQAGARTTLVVSPGTQVAVSGEVFRQDTPLGPRVDDAVEASLAGLDPALIEEVATPSVERLSRYSAQLRFDAARATTSQVFVRGGAAYTKRVLDGPGPLAIARDAALAEESIEFSVAAGWTSEYRPGLVFDFRAGVSGSDRAFERPSPGRSFGYLAGSGSYLGLAAAAAADVARVDVLVLPGLRWSVGPGTLKFGLSARATSHTIEQLGRRELFYTDGPALVATRGVVWATDAPDVSFSAREVGGYAQYDFELSPALSGSLGARFDQEMIPESEPTLNTAWLAASGLRNDVYPASFGQLGLTGMLTWDPSLDGSTRIFGTVSVHHGDLDAGALSQLFSQDGAATSTLFAGTGLTWPMGMVPGGATPQPMLTLFGPDARAPRSTRGTVGFVQRVASSWNLHLGAAYRRTDFLLRRRDLNLPAVASATDPYGRSVFGTLALDGSLVSATAADVRRFAGFNEAWALDPDGWSEYWGVTTGLEYAGASSTFSVAYTRSETTDNWIGAATGLADAQLSPLLPGSDDWSEGTSDFDAPDRVVATASTRLSVLTLSAVYRYRSGLPFTPRYRAGVDANGDGSLRNDVAYVDAALAAPLLDAWKCLDDALDAFAARNSCRGPAVHGLDVRLSFQLGRVMGREARLVVDGLDVIESEDGLIDDALLLVDPTGTLTSSGGTVTIPVIVNPDFGKVVYPSSRGRMLRIGLRIG